MRKKKPLELFCFVFVYFQVQPVRKVLQEWVRLISLSSALSQWEMAMLKKEILSYESFGLSQSAEKLVAVNFLKASHNQSCL